MQEKRDKLRKNFYVYRSQELLSMKITISPSSPLHMGNEMASMWKSNPECRRENTVRRGSQGCDYKTLKTSEHFKVLLHRSLQADQRPTNCKGVFRQQLWKGWGREREKEIYGCGFCLIKLVINLFIRSLQYFLKNYNQFGLKGAFRPLDPQISKGRKQSKMGYF